MTAVTMAGMLGEWLAVAKAKPKVAHLVALKVNRSVDR
jgi:hypothetical protein